MLKYLLVFIRETSSAGFHLYWLLVLMAVTLQSCQQEPRGKRGSFLMPLSSTEALEKNAGSKCWADGNFINHSSFTQGKGYLWEFFWQQFFYFIKKIFFFFLLYNNDCLVTNKYGPDSQGYWLAIILVFSLLTFSWLLASAVTYIVIAGMDGI